MGIIKLPELQGKAQDLQNEVQYLERNACTVVLNYCCPV
jgi:hypothetical protein